MRHAKIISVLGTLAIIAMLIYSFTIGDFMREGSQLTKFTLHGK